jgi:hypothetical protein
MNLPRFIEVSKCQSPASKQASQLPKTPADTQQILSYTISNFSSNTGFQLLLTMWTIHMTSVF